MIKLKVHKILLYDISHLLHLSNKNIKPFPIVHSSKGFSNVKPVGRHKTRWFVSDRKYRSGIDLQIQLPDWQNLN